jgi:NADH-quinone oxidoreductase subunit B
MPSHEPDPKPIQKAAELGRRSPYDRAAEMVEVLRQGSDSFLTTKADTVINWARKYSMFLYPFVTACCGMEFMSVAGPRYDVDRFGCALPRFSPRQADLLMVVGTITHRQGPILKKVYDQMAEPKWVMAFGACTCSGGPYNNYAVVQGIDTIIPVDIYVPGCPPRPEAVLDGLIKLQARVQAEKVGSRGRHLETSELPVRQVEKPVA